MLVAWDLDAMGRVSLILPLASASALSGEWVARCRCGLERAGLKVEVFAVLPADQPRPADPSDRAWTWLSASARGLASATMTGLGCAGGDYLIALDPTQGYQPDDLAHMVEPLIAGRADLVIARRVEGAEAPRGLTARGRRLAAAGAGRITRPLLGASDLFSGLVALTSDLAHEVASSSFDPVGSRFAVDLLLRSKGRRLELPVRVEGPRSLRPLGLDDLRHAKRLADDRFGNASRLIQFCAVGASGMVIDLSSYAAFQLLLSRTGLAGRTTPVLGGPLDLAVAAALAIAIALTWNFSLNRRLTFNYARSGSIVRQYLTYVLSNSLGIALSYSLRLFLPAHVGFFDRHKLAAAVVGIVTATGISFSMSRWLVFSRAPGPAVRGDGSRTETKSAVAQTTSAS
jgi:dolichol-phosphate mannosyltransferase